MGHPLWVARCAWRFDMDPQGYWVYILENAAGRFYGKRLADYIPRASGLASFAWVRAA